MERQPEHSPNGPSSVMPSPVDAAATLVASSGPLNGEPSDGDEPAGNVPALHASACAEIKAPKGSDQILRWIPAFGRGT